MTPAVELRGIEKRFGATIAVRHLDLAVEPGAFVALLGPSGCGKTTTLRMIAGLEQPSAGEIVVKGRSLAGIPIHRRNFGLVFQNFALFPHKTVFDNVAFGLRYRKVPKPEIERRVRRALETVRLPAFGDRLPSQLSGGQQQRVAVARAIVIEPDLLLFDEPLSALDAGLREEMRVEIKRIQRGLGITTIFVTHDQAEALSMADKVVLMRDGAIEQAGTPEQIYTAPQTEFAARFFGTVNELSGTVIEVGGGRSIVALAGGQAVEVARALQPGPVRLLVRAERVALRPTGGSAAALTGTVTGSDYLGLLVRYSVRIGDAELVSIQSVGAAMLAASTPVELTIAPAAWIPM